MCTVGATKHSGSLQHSEVIDGRSIPIQIYACVSVTKSPSPKKDVGNAPYDELSVYKHYYSRTLKVAPVTETQRPLHKPGEERAQIKSKPTTKHRQGVK